MKGQKITASRREARALFPRSSKITVLQYRSGTILGSDQHRQLIESTNAVFLDGEKEGGAILLF